jgi:hypothetical protein
MCSSDETAPLGHLLWSAVSCALGRNCQRLQSLASRRVEADACLADIQPDMADACLTQLCARGRGDGKGECGIGMLQVRSGGQVMTPSRMCCMSLTKSKGSSLRAARGAGRQADKPT